MHYKPVAKFDRNRIIPCKIVVIMKENKFTAHAREKGAELSDSPRMSYRYLRINDMDSMTRVGWVASHLN